MFFFSSSISFTTNKKKLISKDGFMFSASFDWFHVLIIMSANENDPVLIDLLESNKYAVLCWFYSINNL